MFEYCPVFWREHDTARVLKRLNELGAENWQPAFVIGSTIILCRAVDGEKAEPIMNVHIRGDKNE